MIRRTRLKQAREDRAEQLRLHAGAQKDQEAAETDANRVVAALKGLEKELTARFVDGKPFVPAPFLGRVGPAGASSTCDWLRDGTYPNVQELQGLRDEQQVLHGADDELRILEAARDDAVSLNSQVQMLDRRMAEIRNWMLMPKHPEVAVMLVRLTEAEEAISKEIAGFTDLARLADSESAGAAALGRIEAAAKRPAEEADSGLAVARDVRKRTEQQRLDAQHEGGKLSEGLHACRELRLQYAEAARQSRAHRTLAAKLGREALQSYLRVTAERAIVANANAILQRLSDGMLILSLVENFGKPLDLRVTDHEKGGRQMLTQALSGSQKFRVAVALALGIGQYACGLREGGVKSVIIDEGFGSLDRDGREKMIEELNNLGRILERIVVVSHQEEFETAFPNRWRIYMDSGSAHAELVV